MAELENFKTGDIVAIAGAFFKCDNGLFLVNKSYENPHYNCEKGEYAFLKISKNGKINKKSCTLWPLRAFVNDAKKRIAANAWNKENVKIKLASVSDMSEVIAHFQEEADNAAARAKNSAFDWGEDAPVVKMEKDAAEFYQAVVNRLKSEITEKATNEEPKTATTAQPEAEFIETDKFFQVKFSAKPAAEVLENLKKNGFKWFRVFGYWGTFKNGRTAEEVKKALNFA